MGIEEPWRTIWFGGTEMVSTWWWAGPGFRGNPIATVAFYGPSDKLATKIVVSVILTESNEPDFLPALVLRG